MIDEKTKDLCVIDLLTYIYNYKRGNKMLNLDYTGGMNNTAVDIVNKPPHYQTKNGIETIDVIEAFTEDLEGMEAICTANVIKYICRWKKKNGVEDLKKAKWYLNRLISTLEGAESE